MCPPPTLLQGHTSPTECRKRSRGSTGDLWRLRLSSEQLRLSPSIGPHGGLTLTLHRPRGECTCLDPSQALSVPVTWPQVHCKAGWDCPTSHVPKHARVPGRGQGREPLPVRGVGVPCQQTLRIPAVHSTASRALRRIWKKGDAEFILRRTRSRSDLQSKPARSLQQETRRGGIVCVSLEGRNCI